MPLPVAPDMLVVSEIVPSTVVGDGPLAGWRCAMIRLGGCNLACTWCDVPYSWDGSRTDLQVTLNRRLVHNIVEDALVSSPRLVIITGGEPLLQERSPGPEALEAWVELADLGKVAFSFVVRDRMDIRTVATLADIHGISRDLIWISPEGATRSRVLEVIDEVAEVALAQGFSLAPRAGVLSGIPSSGRERSAVHAVSLPA